MFRDIWDSRRDHLEDHRHVRKAEVRKATDLMIETRSMATARVMKAKLEKLECHKAQVTENLAKSSRNQKTSLQVFEPR